jgi:hypothetical protein
MLLLYVSFLADKPLINPFILVLGNLLKCQHERSQERKKNNIHTTMVVGYSITTAAEGSSVPLPCTSDQSPKRKKVGGSISATENQALVFLSLEDQVQSSRTARN